jgi:DNA end-binding protein Ku
MAKKRKREKHSHPPRQQTGLRPFWSGTITFGLVSVPVNLYPAARRGGMPLRMLDEDGTPLARRYYCPEHNREVHPEHLLRGYEVEEGKYVIVRDEELESLAPRKSRDIDLTRFVPKDSIPPLYFQRAYFLTPGGDSSKAYRLLSEVMEKTGRAGVATFVMRGKEYLIAVISERGILRAETMRFEDELRDTKALDLPARAKLKAADVKSLAKLVQRMTRANPPADAFIDHATERMRKLVESKQKKGQDVVESEAPPADEEAAVGDETPAVEQVDLLETIRRSLAGRNGHDGRAGGNNRHGRGRRRHARDRLKPGLQRARNEQPAHGLSELSKEELYERAQKQDVPGRSQMSKQQLIRALRKQ